MSTLSHRFVHDHPSEKTATRVAAVSRSETHGFSKRIRRHIRLLAGRGVENDAHCGRTVQHLSRKAVDPRSPNLRQVHLIGAELLEELRTIGFHIGPGDLGENITTVGVPLLDLPTGTRIRFGGGAVIEVTGLRNPCSQIERFRPGLLARVLEKDEKGGLVRRCGVMAVIVTGGVVRPGETVTIELAPEPHIPLQCI